MIRRHIVAAATPTSFRLVSYAVVPLPPPARYANTGRVMSARRSDKHAHPSDQARERERERERGGDKQNGRKDSTRRGKDERRFVAERDFEARTNAGTRTESLPRDITSSSRRNTSLPPPQSPPLPPPQGRIFSRSRGTGSPRVIARMSEDSASGEETLVRVNQARSTPSGFREALARGRGGTGG
jgi:hypothetical protein